MRTVLPVSGGGGGDGGEPRSLRSRVGCRMKKLLRPSPCVGIHTDTEPGVWLRSFQFLDTDGECEVSVSADEGEAAHGASHRAGDAKETDISLLAFKIRPRFLIIEQEAQCNSAWHQYFCHIRACFATKRLRLCLHVTEVPL